MSVVWFGQSVLISIYYGLMGMPVGGKGVNCYGGLHFKPNSNRPIMLEFKPRILIFLYKLQSLWFIL